MRNSFASSKQLNRLIGTPSIDELESFIQVFEKRAFPPIGLITSPAGYGKTMAVAYLADSVFSASFIGFESNTLLVTIPTAPTNLAIAQTTAGQLNERFPHSRPPPTSLREEIAPKSTE